MGLRNKLRKAYDAGFNNGYHGEAKSERYRFAEKRRDQYEAGYSAGDAKARERGVLATANGIPGEMADYEVVAREGVVRIKRGTHTDKPPRPVFMGFWPGFMTPPPCSTGKIAKEGAERQYVVSA